VVLGTDGLPGVRSTAREAAAVGEVGRKAREAQQFMGCVVDPEADM
jgi:hypothetical protein